MSAFGIVTIGLTAAWGVVSILATFVWRFFASIFEVVQAFVMSLLSNKALVIIPALAFIFGVGFAATYEQPFIMENVDTIYSCYVLPAGELTFSILHTMVEFPYHYLAHGFNLSYPYIVDVVSNYIQSVKALGAPTTLLWYGEFFNNTYFLIRNMWFFWAYVPSWQIPFGVNAFVAAQFELQWCFWFDWMENIYVQLIEFIIFNAYCPYCEYDPDATCAIRKKWFPQAPDPPDANCTGCQNLPCIFVYCTFRAIDNFTEPIQQGLDFDLTPRLFMIADDACCVISQSLPPLLFLVVGIVDNLIATNGCSDPSNECAMVSPCDSAKNLTHFVVFTWLGQLASCLDQLVEDATFGFIDDFLVLIFEALLPVIQVLIASVECTQNSTFVSCLEAYPGSCAVNSGLVPTDGLFVCADIWGECVLDNAPIIDLEPFITILTSTIPTIIQFSIDLFTCNFYVALTVCLTDSSISDCDPNSGPAFFTCIGSCLGGTPLGVIYNSFVTALAAVINAVCTAITTACNALSISCPCGFPILDAIEISTPRVCIDKNVALPRYSSQIDPDLFCGNVLLTWNNDTDWRKQENWASYLIHELCTNLFITGVEHIERDEALARDMNVSINDFITPQRMFEASKKLEKKIPRADANGTRSKSSLPRFPIDFVGTMAQVHATLSTSPYYNLVSKYTRQRDALYKRFDGSATTVTMWDGTSTTADLSDQNNAFEKAAYMRGLGQEEESLKLSFLDAMRDLNKKNRMPVPWHSRRNPGLYGRAGPPSADKSPHDELANFIARRNSNPRRDYEVQVGRYEPTYRTYSKEELEKSHAMIDTALSHARGIIDPAARLIALLNHDGGLPERAARYFNADHWDSYQTAHMLLHVASTNDGAAYGDYLGGKTSYLAGEGFVSHARYHQVMDETKANAPPPEYDPDSTRVYGPFFTDPHIKWFPNFNELFARNRVLIEGAHARRIAKLQELGYNTTGMNDMDAILALDASGSFGSGIQTVFGILEYFINDVFGTLTHILFGIKLDINLARTGQKIIDFFTGRIITIDTLKKAGETTHNFVTCHYPQDVDGTNIFNPFCFPCIPENAFSWMVTVPNSIFPMQIPWPKELIAQDCVTPFNGNGNLFFYKKSNVCPTPDMYSRPFCPTCDVCIREYNECLHISTVNSPIKTLFFTTGAIPVLVDDFLNGGIPADKLFPFIVIFSVVFMLAMAPSLGFGIQLVFLPFAFFFPLLVYYSLVQVFSFFGPAHGESGKIVPFGVIYLFLLVFVGIFFSSALNVTSGLGIFLWLFAALWVLNLAVRLKPFESVFNINHYAHNFFWAIDNGPSPLKYVDWSAFVHYTELYDFEKNPIRSVDITCYFWTWGNAVILIVTAYLMFWFVYWMYLVLLAIALMIINLALLVFVTYRAVQQWSFNMKTVNSAETIEEMQEEMKRAGARLKLHDSFIAKLDPSFLRIRSESYFSTAKAPPKWRVVYPPIGQPYLERSRPKTKEL